MLVDKFDFIYTDTYVLFKEKFQQKTQNNLEFIVFICFS